MKNVSVNGITYNGITNVRLNTTNGSTATFIDAEELNETLTGRVLHLTGASEVTSLQLFDSSGSTISKATTIAITNKNIFRADLIAASTVSQGITFTKNVDGSFTAKGTSTGSYASASCQMDANAFEVGKAYTISSGKTAGYLYVQLIVNYTDGTTDYIVARNSPRTFTINKAVQSASASVQITDSGVTLNNETIYPQIEIAGAASAFIANVYKTMQYDGSTMPTLPADVANMWPLSATVASMTVSYTLAAVAKINNVTEQAEAAFAALNNKADKSEMYTFEELESFRIKESEIDNIF